MASADPGLMSRSDVLGTSPMVQWLRLCASNARGEGLNPGWGSKIPLASQSDSKQTNKQTSDACYFQAGAHCQYKTSRAP